VLTHVGIQKNGFQINYFSVILPNRFVVFFKKSNTKNEITK